MIATQTHTLPINEHLQLQAITTDDIAQIYSLIDANRTYLLPWLPWVNITKSKISTQTFVEEVLETGPSKTQVFTIRYGSQNEIVGLIDLHNIHTYNKFSCIGYWIAQKYSNKGITTKATQCIMEYGFKHLQLKKVYIFVNAKNFASQQIPIKLNFTQMDAKKAPLILQTCLPVNESFFCYFKTAK